MQGHLRRLRGPVGVLVLLCVAGLGLRIYLGWWLGALGDLECYQTWALDPGELIPPHPDYQIQANNYPPIFPSILRLLRWTHRALDLPGDFRVPMQLAPEVAPFRPIILLIKMPAILSDLVSAVLIFLIGVRLRQVWVGCGLAAMYLFNPAILYDGAYYGQTDTFLLMFLIAAVYAWLTQRPILLGAMLITAPLVKAQAVFFLPVMGLAILGEWRTVWRAQVGRLLLGAGGALAAAVALAWLTGQLIQFKNGYTLIIALYPRVTSYAFNLWWLLTRPWHKTPYNRDFPLDTVAVFGPIAYRMIGLALFAVGMLLILWRLHRARYTPYALVLAATAAGWAFFNLPTEMHERYSVPAAGLMCLLAYWDRRWLAWAGLASVTVTLNIAYVVPLFLNNRWVTAVTWFLRPERHMEWTIFAVIHVLMLPLVLQALWRQGSGAAEPTPGAAGGFPLASVEAPERSSAGEPIST